MKTLEQLGISPAPWKVAMDDIAMVFSGSQYPSLSTPHICEVDIIDDPERKCNDIKLIAAAPELYKSLAAMLSCAEKEAPFTTESGMSIAMDMARKALAKAAGESEVNK